MRDRLTRFMTGRNGNDQLNTCLLVITVVLMLLAGIFSKSLGIVLYPLTLLLLGLVYFRMFSRNVFRRREENEKFLRLLQRGRTWLRLRKERWVQRRDYKFFTCPFCKTVLRVPRGKGKIKLVCRKCGTSFFGKS